MIGFPRAGLTQGGRRWLCRLLGRERRPWPLAWLRASYSGTSCCAAGLFNSWSPRGVMATPESPLTQGVFKQNSALASGLGCTYAGEQPHLPQGRAAAPVAWPTPMESPRTATCGSNGGFMGLLVVHGLASVPGSAAAGPQRPRRPCPAQDTEGHTGHPPFHRAAGVLLVVFVFCFCLLLLF